jgi:hypothetical protein
MALVGSLSSHQVNMVTHNPQLAINIIVVIQINGIKPSNQNLFIFVKNEKNDNTSPICFNTLHVIIMGKTHLSTWCGYNAGWYKFSSE